MCVSCLQLRKACSETALSLFLFSKQRMCVSRKWDLPECGWAVSHVGQPAWSGLASRQAWRSTQVAWPGKFQGERLGWGSGLSSWQLEIARNTGWRLEQDRCESPGRRGLVLGPLLNMQESPGFCRWSPTAHLSGNQSCGRLLRAGSRNEIDQEGPIGATPGTGVS